MELTNRFIVFATCLALISSSAISEAAINLANDNTGAAYNDSLCSAQLAPVIALGLIAGVAVLVICVAEASHHHHGHH